jgi:maltose O-acetyltransferase
LAFLLFAVTSEQEKMLGGELYDAADPTLVAARRRARELCRSLNDTSPGDLELRRRLLAELFGGAIDTVTIEPPFYCDYGANITLGSRVYFNYNCIILDSAPVRIGNDVIVGPSVQIYTPLHPMKASERRTWLESAQPVEIGSDVWIGGGAVICPGTRVGPRSVIGAGSVVTRDIPENVFAAGNPCRVIRRIDPDGRG